MLYILFGVNGHFNFCNIFELSSCLSRFLYVSLASKTSPSVVFLGFRNKSNCWTISLTTTSNIGDAVFRLVLYFGNIFIKIRTDRNLNNVDSAFFWPDINATNKKGIYFHQEVITCHTLFFCLTNLNGHFLLENPKYIYALVGLWSAFLDVANPIFLGYTLAFNDG